MISYKQSRKILSNSKIEIRNESIKSSKSINRVTAEDILCETNSPAGNNAAFDGFAINSKETNKLSKKRVKLFKILGIISAGDKPKKKIYKSSRQLKL